jgi:hypothetical protein
MGVGIIINYGSDISDQKKSQIIRIVLNPIYPVIPSEFIKPVVI